MENYFCVGKCRERFRKDTVIEESKQMDDKQEKGRIKINIYRNALDELKAEGFGEFSLLSLGKDATRMISVWPRVRRVIVNDPFENKNVDLAWRYVDFDAYQWAGMAGVEEKMIWEKWQGLANSKLIYPDGTYPDEVGSYLRLKTDELMDRVKRS